MDFCVVPTITFRLLNCLIFFDHQRRKIVFFNVTQYPDKEWIRQQFRNAFPHEHKYKYIIRDHDKKFGHWIQGTIKVFKLIDKPIAYRSPWQNAFCERMIGTLKFELLNRVIIFNEAHLEKMIKIYLGYYHKERTHIGLSKDTPNGKLVACSGGKYKIQSQPQVGGLYHSYKWVA